MRFGSQEADPARFVLTANGISLSATWSPLTPGVQFISPGKNKNVRCISLASFIHACNIQLMGVELINYPIQSTRDLRHARNANNAVDSPRL